MVSALKNVVVSGRTGIVHCFIRVGKTCRLLSLKAQFPVLLHTDEAILDFDLSIEKALFPGKLNGSFR
ncbi:hypothetical protein ABMA09_04285 [Erwinia rhapontici]|nr:hypothetical protein [Erwinia rhapontici]